MGLSEEAVGVGDGVEFGGAGAWSVGDGFVGDVAWLEEEVEGHGGGAGEAVGEERQCVFCGVAVEDAQA